MPTISFDKNDIENILDGMVEGVITINDRGIILSFNKSAETMFGYYNNDIIGEKLNMLMLESDRIHHDKYLHQYVNTQEAHIIGMGRNVIAVKKNGEQFPIRLSVIEYPAKNEGERWFIGSCLDITLQQQQEEQLRRNLKMEALGTMASGISHDYNNILGIILGYVDLISERHTDDAEYQGYLSQIKRAALRGKTLTQKLKSLSKKQSKCHTVIDINRVLKEDQIMLANMLTSKIKMQLLLDDKLWPVLVDGEYFEDMIINVIINSMQAMLNGGLLDIVTENIILNSIDAQVLNIHSGDYVKVSIRDNGIGMDDEIVAHIFEPFFTTKAEQGTGLGLSQAYNFVKQSGGIIQVDSEPGHGTCFSFYLPRSIQETSKIAN